MRQASELLGLSPPALSKAIRLLEEELGYDLIQADGRGLLITEKGKLLATRGENVLKSIDELETGDQTNPQTTPFRLGTFEVFSTFFWGEYVERFASEKQHSLYELIPGQIEDAIEKNRIDLGITYLPIPHAGVEHIKVAEIEMGIYSSLDPRFTKKDISQIPFVVPITPLFGIPSKVQGLDGWPDDLVSRNIVYQVTLMQSCIEIVTRGLAIAYLPTFISRLHNLSCSENRKLKKLPSPQKIGSGKQAVYLVKRKGSEESQVFKSYAKALRLITKTS
jgi:DNA-binding transcriptional LysR family regulator